MWFSGGIMLVLSVFLTERSQFYVREVSFIEVSFIVGQTQTCSSFSVKVVGEQITTKSLGFQSLATVTYGPADHLTWFQSPVWFIGSLDHLNWKGPLKVIWSNSPAMNRDTYSSIRCSEPHPTWPWASPGMEHSPHLWAALFQCFPALILKT